MFAAATTRLVLAQHAAFLPDRTIFGLALHSRSHQADHSLYVNRSVAADGEAKFRTRRKRRPAHCPIRFRGPQRVLLRYLTPTASPAAIRCAWRRS